MKKETSGLIRQEKPELIQQRYADVSFFMEII